MTASADRGLRPEQVAEIIVTLPDRAERRRGTGYLFAPGKVLTVAHVVEGATEVRVRFQADQPGERTVEADVLWQHSVIDVAILALRTNPVIDVEPATFGRVGDHGAVLPCTAMGFPRFKLRTDDDGSRFRDAEHIHTNCAVLSNRREGTLDLAIASPPAADPDPERDAWEGMSGAAVFGNGRLVGVVARRHLGDGPGRIAASRVDRWARSLSPTELAELELASGRLLDPAALPDAIPVTAPDLTQEAFRAQLANDFAPPELEDRESELRRLVAFCSGSEQYLRLQGPPWAGKTSLAAWFALHPPRGVVPVWFFITKRNARQSDSDAFTDALIDQLAAITGHESTGHHSPTVRAGMRSLLLDKAAERVAQRGGILLLVVDGLDEDQSLTLGGSGPSIASLLPERPPPNVRVLVTSRPSPDLPADLKGGHPLRDCRVLELTATEAARHIEYEAKLDLQQALSGDQLQIDLVGFLTAARGTLTAEDLRALTGARNHELTRRLGSAFGRILRERGTGADSGGDVTLYVAGHGYLFAHETLLSAAQDELGQDVDMYWERLHAWADRYRRQGWPEHTPLYLLQPYGRLVTLLHDVRRAVDLATDVRRRDRLREVTGSDAACLAEIVAAQQVLRRTTPDDLGALACLAAAGDLVARRNESLHPDIPAGYARLGRVRHAIGLAHSVFDPMDRVWALRGVANVLAQAGDRRAVALAEKALRLTLDTVNEHLWLLHGGSGIDAALATLVVALVATGNESEAMRRLDELRRPDTVDGVATFAQAARVAQNPECAADLLSRAEKLARRIPVLSDRVRALAAVADAWTARAEPCRAARQYDAVVALAEEHAEAPENIPATAAEILYRVRPREAKHMAELATEHLGAVWFSIRSSTDRQTDRQRTYGAIRALAATGRVDEAHLLRNYLSRVARPPLSTGSAIAEARAREGRAAEAWAELEASWKSNDPPAEDDTAARVAGLLAAAGVADELETLLLTATSTWWWPGIAQALAALAVHFADADPDRSLRLLRQAERAHHLTGGTDDLTQDERVAALAGALAAAGRPDEAEPLVEAIGTPDVRAWAYAAVSLAVGREDAHRALRLAEHAVSAIPAIDDDCDWVMRAHLLTAVVQALACAGAVERAMEGMERLAKEFRIGRMSSTYLNRARAVTAGGLWRHDADAAGFLADALLSDIDSSSLQSLTGLGELLAAVVPHNVEHGARVREILLGLEQDDLPEQGWYHDAALLALMTATVDAADARRRLDRLASAYEPSPLHFWLGTAEALAYTVLDEHEAARAVAHRIAAEGDRSKTLSALAGYVACIPVDPMVVPLNGEGWTHDSTARRLAAHYFPPPTGPDLPRARALLAEALTPDGWHHALPVLAAIEPEAVIRVRDVVLAYLGLSD